MKLREFNPAAAAALVPFWEILLILLGLAATLGVLFFWGATFGWIELIGIALASVGFSGAALIFRTAALIRGGNFASRRMVRRLTTAVGAVREEPAETLLTNASVLALVFCCAGLSGFFPLFIAAVDRGPLLLWLGLTVLFAVVDLNRIASVSRDWTAELFEGLEIFALPALLTVALQDVAQARLSILAFLVPNLFFYFGYRFLKAMADADLGTTFQPGLFPTMIRRGLFRGYALMAALGYVSIVALNLSGVPWRLVSPMIFGLPLFTAGILLVERVRRGERYHRKLIGGLGMGALLFILYVETITGWIFA